MLAMFLSHFVIANRFRDHFFLGLDENYCRNPTLGGMDAPFCMYQGTHSLSRESCDIPQCKIVGKTGF